MEQKLGQVEYEETLLYHVSKLVINRNYIIENESFFDGLLFKLYEEYLFGEEISIIKQQKP